MTLDLNPDRLFPADPETRALAREIYAEVKDLPILSPHGHVDPRLLLDNEPFADPTTLFLTFDHYVFRMLHANGVDLRDVGVGTADPVDPREAWRILCANWHVLEGTASGYWLTDEFVSLFGIDEEPSAQSADRLYDQISEKLATEEFRPRALFARFKIAFLATTDDPLDDLEAHAELARLHEAGELYGRVVPTWRPDRFLDPNKPGFTEAATALADSVGGDPRSLADYLRALKASRERFIEAGAISADHGVPTPYTIDLDDDALEALLVKAVDGTASEAEKRDFTGAMLVRCAQMSVEDGLVMTLHPSVFRNHSTATFERFGPDTGHDIPEQVEYTRNIRPLLEKVGLEEGFHLVLFGIDETMYSREVAPLAGFYPSVFIGAPWWFIDAPDAILRFRSAITETAGFTRGSGFIDDTRAFLSIPTRHDMARRCDAAFLARYVMEGRLPKSSALRIIRELTVDQPARVFKLESMLSKGEK